MLGEVLSGCGERKLAVLHALGGYEPLREVAHLLAGALEDEHFKAVVMVEVHMQRGDDDVVHVVLYLGESLCEVALVVVVDEGERTGDFAVGVITVFAAGREWTLERAADLQTLWDNMVEADFGDDERLPYWTELWPSSLVLADWLHDNAGRIRGRTCLDMGCGLGLCSLVGQWLGARVTGMDYEPEALFHARRNAERNRVPQPLWTVMDWRAPAVRRHAADLVWGGDIMYERRFVTPVLDFLDHVLAPCGAAWVAEPGRTVYNHFRETLDARGWHARRVLSSETASLYEQPESVTVHLWEITR